MGLQQPAVSATDALPEHALVALARRRDESAIRALTRRYNQRLFRITRGILRNDVDAEDAVQDAYVKAFTSLDRFRGDAAFGTWLIRIAMNEATGRLRRRRHTVDFSTEDEAALTAHILTFPDASRAPSPETAMAHDQIRAILERSIDALPESFRVAFVARVVEGLSVEETSALLGIRPETVKTRVFRARARLRRELERQLGENVTGAFPFAGARCERVTAAVLARLGLGG
jgi:RNA polymerase sigma-70 factor (ECF subfamily)